MQEAALAIPASNHLKPTNYFPLASTQQTSPHQPAPAPAVVSARAPHTAQPSRGTHTCIPSCFRLPAQLAPATRWLPAHTACSTILPVLQAELLAPRCTQSQVLRAPAPCKPPATSQHRHAAMHHAGTVANNPSKCIPDGPLLAAHHITTRLAAAERSCRQQHLHTTTPSQNNTIASGHTTCTCTRKHASVLRSKHDSTPQLYIHTHHTTPHTGTCPVLAPLGYPRTAPGARAVGHK